MEIVLRENDVDKAEKTNVMKSLRFRSRNHWGRLEHNNWSTGYAALSSDFRYSERLREQVVREWLAGEKSQSARESYGVFSHKIRMSSA